MHSNGVIYADLKPSTVLVNEYNTVKLSDFGLARKTTDYQTNVGYPLGKTGTPFYMAPELFEDNPVYSFASDLWSFGCVLFELATGKPPFYSKSLNQHVRMLLSEPIPIGELPRGSKLASLIEGLLEKDPAKRLRFEEVIRHPFWDGCEEHLEEMARMKIPEEPQFNEYLASRGIDPIVHK